MAVKRPGVYWHIFPTYSEAKDAVWRDPNMLFSIIPPELIEKVNESDLVVYLKTKPVSLLQLKGSDQFERLLGANPYGVVLDEFAEMKYETWQRVIEPIIRANNGWCWFVGTPRGRNHLYEVYQRGQIANKEWHSSLVRADTSGIIDPEQLENSRITMPQSLYHQEWLCDFLEGEGVVFRKVREAAYGIPMQPQANHIYVMGVDLAKVQDYTVIVIYDRLTNRQVYQDRFQHLDWNFQKKRIKEISKHYNDALCVLDATGLGDPIADDLVREGVPVKPIKISEPIKKELIEKLSIWIEQKQIGIIPIRETFFEFDNFSYEIGSTGKVRYQAREGFNDDIVIAHALAAYELTPKAKYIPPPPEEPRIRQHLKQITADKSYYTQSESNEW